MHISRRHFLKAPVLAGVAAQALATVPVPRTGIPTRILGRTGVRIPILLMGGGSRFLKYGTPDAGAAALNRAFDLGVNYIDTGHIYGNGTSEEWVGAVLQTRRKEAFLASKVFERDGDKAMRIVEAALKRLRTDHFDLLNIQGVEDSRDLERIEAPGGVLNAFLKLRDQKVARFLGITSHYGASTLAQALERHDFDVTQMALNAGKTGWVKTADTSCFEDTALPVALRKKMGVIAMKVFAQDRLLGHAPLEKLLYYAWSLPISAAVVGMPKLEMLEANVALAKAFRPLPKEEMRRLSEEVSSKNKLALDTFFRDHVDA